MKHLLILREGVKSDVESIFKLIELYAPSGVVLRRSRENIESYLGNFAVAEFDGEIVGCCAVRDFGNDLLEIRSLVVKPELQGKGIGKALLNGIISGVKLRRSKWRLFTLTLQVNFFRSLGFKVVPRENFPEKIWSDCTQCAKNTCCDETALILESID